MGRGRLRIYLGAAPGVGKTFAMLNEGRRRRARGTDVVVALVETHGRERTAAQVGDLEVVPRCRVDYRGTTFEEMDLDAVLTRRPAVALVDELAHTNVPGCRNEKRWQDVHELLEQGIDVISTVNVQHLESMNDIVETITGIHQHETIPDEIVRAADQIELVDMTAEALRQRMAHGNVYALDKIDAALANYFRIGNLDALRELALLWVADRVDEALLEYREVHGIERTWETRERVVVAVTGAASGEHLIRRAARMAQRGHSELLGIHVRSTDGRRDATPAMLEKHRRLLEGMGGVYHEVVADDVVAALVEFAQRENATQLVLGATRRSRWAEITRGSVINALIRKSGAVDVHVISQPQDDETATAEATRPAESLRKQLRPRHGLGPRRRAAGWLGAVAGTGAVTLVLANGRGVFDQGSQFLLYQALVLVVAAAGGAAPALTAAVLASIALNWFFIPPFYTWTIEDPDNVLALVVFAAVGAAVGLLVTEFARRTAAARRASQEAEALVRVAGGLVGVDDPLPSMLERVRSTLAIDGVALVSTADAGTVLASAGTLPDPGGAVTMALDDEVALVLGGDLGFDDRRILHAFTTQLATALAHVRLHEEAAAAGRLAETDALRTAVLRAVSHDLRTPLASIKASVTSLLQVDIAWSEHERSEFLQTIEEECDRLDQVVGNLLDASRLEAGAVRPVLRAFALDEVVPIALGTVSHLDVPVRVDVDPALPLVVADEGLLERVVANLVANAATHAPTGRPIGIVGTDRGDWVELRVVDHGAGLGDVDRTNVFAPFQRAGDAPGGVGLGLSVVKGFVEAMDGTVVAEDTAGGGLTMIVRLRRSDDGR